MGGVIDNDPLEDEDLREASAAAEKKNANEPRQVPPVMEKMEVQMKVMEKARHK